jgi:hypothetical protein
MMNKTLGIAQWLYLKAIRGQLNDDPSRYYYLPADIIGLLLDYLPIHLHAKCYLVPCIAVNGRIRYVVSEHDKLIDSIIKHDLEYFKQCWSDLSLTRYNQIQCLMRRQNTIFLDTLFDCWRQAFTYGRLRFLDVLMEVDRAGYAHKKKEIQQMRLPMRRSDGSVITHVYALRAHEHIDYCDPYNNSPTYTAVINDRHLFEQSLNIETIEWIHNNCVFEPRPSRDFALIDRAIKAENTLMLELIYNRVTGYEHDLISTILLDYDTHRRRLLDHIYADIRSKPKVFEWFKSHKWPEGFSAKLFV